MIMEKKVRHIRVRITETQFRWLASVLIAEQRTKSSLLRDALNMYLIEEHGNKIKGNNINRSQ